MFGVLLDEAKKLIEAKKSKVYIVMCEGFFDHCLTNPTGNTGICALCKSQTKKIISNTLGDQATILKLSDYYDSKLSKDKISISTSEEFKKFNYKDIGIGYSALSSYVHLTRNQKPKIDKDSIDYFKNQLLQSMKLIDAFSNLIDDIKPDRVCSFNGRFNEIRPVFEIALIKKVEAYLYEFEPLGNGQSAKVVFKNVLPHSIVGNKWKFEHCWNDSNLVPGENVKLSEEFFHNKRNGIAAGDKVYVKGTTTGKLPDNWNSNKRNIVIFNSSEDEYVSIGEEWESLTLFKEQIEGLKFTFESYKNDESFHFYLRVHPNLKGIAYKYHQNLYEFEKEYSNVTIIGAEESINSYDLLDASEKVIVFGSTMGLEAVYWGKPVILLGCSWYYYEDVCYIPKTTNEFLKLIKQELKPKYNSNVLKLGLFFYYRKSTYIESNPVYSYFNYNPIKYQLFNKIAVGYHYQKLFNSTKLRAYYIAGLKFLSLLLFPDKFSLPKKEE
ncbi:capsular polysaccharide biosynthesis protein [Nonlabens dokdonensis]|nr:capsular polysaccharide biosynthesis protein [Nonlabens dokdonensis]